MDLENTDTPKYLGVRLDRTLSYKTHIHNTKIKLATRNNPLKKLTNSRWGTNARTIRSTALALCYSTAEYAAPVLNTQLNQACRSITGCLKPTNVENLYLLAGISLPEINRSVCARVERTKQVERETHSLYGHTPARSRLKSRRNFLTSVQPVHFPANVVRVYVWKRRLEEKAHAGLVIISSTAPTLSPLDLWTDPAAVTALLARWTEKLAGEPQAGRSDSPTYTQYFIIAYQYSPACSAS